MNKYLLEIGVEELPARFIDLALVQLREKFKNLLIDNSIKYEEINVYATPRRLSVIIKDVDISQQDEDLEVKGPAKKISFDENLNPTKPLIGFMKSQNITVDDIVIKELKGTEYVYANIHKKGESFEEIIRKNIADLIKSINFPKNMRWGGKNIRFARPIRWVVSMLNDKIVDFEFENIPVSNVTRGHRFLGSSNIILNNVDEYESELEKNYVILDQEKRREIIVLNSNKLAKSLGGQIHEDEDLLKELTYIVEYPNPIMGKIKEEYLELPKEVITTPMRDHLRFTPVYNDDGELLPYFITIRNGNDDHKDIVIKGNEKVLGARLEDAKFFYEDDISKDLSDYNEGLKGMMFQDKLGSIYDKTVRISDLSEKIGQELEIAQETKDALIRANELSKADLTTKMVQEFTELQGIMGSIYAKKSGEDDIVSQAIYEQYLPRFANDKLPKSTAGAIMAIADKIDTIVGLFAIGLIPTGSQDPFALRRLAIGIINILNEKNWDISLDELVDFSLYIYTKENALVFDYEIVKENILEFFKARIKNMLQDENIRYDIIDSVLNYKDSPLNILKKAMEIEKFFEEDRDEFVDAFTRIHNIVEKNYVESEIVEELIKNEYEIKLRKDSLSIIEDVEKLIVQKNYYEALVRFETLKDGINLFFDNIMVLDENEKVRNNRLAILFNIDNEMKKIFDIKKIVTN